MAVIRPTEDSDSVIGTSGRDVLQGDDDDNYLDGMAGRDWVFGNGGNDILIFDSTDQMIHGGEGYDTLRFLTGGQTVNLTDKPVIQSIEAINFASTNNRLTFTAADIERMSDNDALVITGGTGNVIDPGSGWHYDGLSSDNHFYKFSQGSVSMSVETSVQMTGFTPPPPGQYWYGDDTNNVYVSYAQNSRLYGGGGDDDITSYNPVSELYGQLGDDTLTAYSAAQLYGGEGNDTLVINSTGLVLASGGMGADTFKISYTPDNTAPVLLDFSPSEGDMIVFESSLGDLTEFDQLRYFYRIDFINEPTLEIRYSSESTDSLGSPTEHVLATIMSYDISDGYLSPDFISIL